MSQIRSAARRGDSRSTSTASSSTRVSFGDPKEAEPSRRSSLWKKLTFATLGVVVALASSSVALVFTLWPGLKPDPGLNFAADVSVFGVDRGVLFGDYLRRTTFTPKELARARDGYPASLLRVRGEVVYVQSTLEGFKRRSVVLRWSLYDARSKQRLRGENFSQISAAQLHLEAPTDRTVQEIWLPPPPGKGPYFVRVELYDKRGVLLAVADSAPFAGLSL
jgi:hypothetical protein